MTITDVVIVAWSTLIVLGVLAAFVSDGVRWLWRRKEVVGEADRDGDLGEGSLRPHSESVAGERSPGVAFPTPPYDPFDEQDRRFLRRLDALCAPPEACWLCQEVGEENCPDHDHERTP